MKRCNQLKILCQEVDQIKTMTDDVEGQMKASASSAESSPERKPETDTSASSIDATSQQSASNPSEQERNMPEKDNK